MATQEKTSLINDVKKLVQIYREKQQDHEQVHKSIAKDLTDSRKKGCDELFEHIKAMIPEKVKTYAGYGRNEARVFEFKFKDELKFDNCYAKDLLTKGDVVARLQEYLDKEHSDSTGPSFLVYFTHIGHFQNDHAENKFGVFINWDKESWTAIKDKLARKPPPNEMREPHDPDRERGRGQHFRGGRGGRGGRGNGRGFGLGARGSGRALSIQPPSANSQIPASSHVGAPAPSHAPIDDLPEKHDE